MEHSKKRKITGDEKAACATIERFYINVVRKNSTWQVCRRFLKASLDKEQEANLTCADMVTYLQRSCFLEGLACVVQRVMYLINYTMKYKEDPCKMPLTGVVGIQALSNAYLAAYHPGHIFKDKDGIFERRVQTSACLFIESLREAAVRLANATVNAHQLWHASVKNDGVSSSLLKYLNALRAWKKVDSKRFSRRQLHILQGLEDMEAEILSSMNPYFLALRKGIAEERQRCRDRLNLANEPTSANDSKPASVIRSLRSPTPLMQQVPRMPRGSPLNRETFIHEMMIEDDFRMQVAFDGDMKSTNRTGEQQDIAAYVCYRLAHNFEKSFWKAVLDDLCEEGQPYMGKLVKVFSEIKKEIQRAATGNSERKRAEELLNPDILRKSLLCGRHLNRLDKVACTGLVYKLFDMACSALTRAGDTNWNDWMVSAENMRNCENTNRGCAAVFVGCVQLCYEAVHGLHNKINYYQTGKKLKLLDFDAVECETSIFLTKVARGTLTTTNTRIWIQEAMPNKTTLEETVCEAWMNVVFCDVDRKNMFSGEHYPELLLLDKKRLVRMNKFVFAGIVGSVLFSVLREQAVLRGTDEQLSMAVSGALEDVWLGEHKHVAVCMAKKAVEATFQGEEDGYKNEIWQICMKALEKEHSEFVEMAVNYKSFFHACMECREEDAKLDCAWPWLEDLAKEQALLLQRMVMISMQSHGVQYCAAIRDT